MPLAAVSVLASILSAPGGLRLKHRRRLTIVHAHFGTGKELGSAGRHDRPPGAPSADPAIADKAEKQQSRGERAKGLSRESGLAGLDYGLARGHGALLAHGHGADKGAGPRRHSLTQRATSRASDGPNASTTRR